MAFINRFKISQNWEQNAKASDSAIWTFSLRTWTATLKLIWKRLTTWRDSSWRYQIAYQWEDKYSVKVQLYRSIFPSPRMVIRVVVSRHWKIQLEICLHSQAKASSEELAWRLCRLKHIIHYFSPKILSVSSFTKIISRYKSSSHCQ